MIKNFGIHTISVETGQVSPLKERVKFIIFLRLQTIIIKLRLDPKLEGGLVLGSLNQAF